MIPDWKLERFLVKGLSKTEMEKIQREESSDEFLHARLETLRKKNLEFSKEHSIDEEILEIQEKATWKRTNATRFYKPLLAAALFLIVLMPVMAPEIHSLWKNSSTDVVTYSEDGTRIKGMLPRFEVWKKTLDSAVILNENSEVSAGDELQIRYLTSEKCYGMIFSMDGLGSITFHLSNDNSSVSLEPGKMHSLNYAYKLDAAPYFEKFYFLLSSTNFTLTAQNLDSLLKNKNVKVNSLRLRKSSSVEGK